MEDVTRARWQARPRGGAQVTARGRARRRPRRVCALCSEVRAASVAFCAEPRAPHPQSLGLLAVGSQSAKNTRWMREGLLENTVCREVQESGGRLRFSVQERHRHYSCAPPFSWFSQFKTPDA